MARRRSFSGSGPRAGGTGRAHGLPRSCTRWRATTGLTKPGRRAHDRRSWICPADAVIYRAVGCEKCRHIGYKGRTDIFEVLTMRAELQQMIAEKAPLASIRAAAIERGLLLPFAGDVPVRITAGETSIEEIARVLHGVFPPQ